MTQTEHTTKRHALPDHAEIVADVAREYGVDEALLQVLLELETKHQNLHRHGALQALRRDIDTCLKDHAAR